MSTETLNGSVLGAWTLQSVLRQGGIETVFLARDSSGRQATVKALDIALLPLDQRPAFLERFRLEATQLISLKHPHILPVYECGIYDHFAFLVSPLIQGGILRDVLEQEAPLPLPKVMNLLQQLALALDYAHARGVLHLDLTPGAIFKVAENHLLISDFGMIALLFGDKTLQQRIAEKNVLPRTLAYVAPEQIGNGPVDKRSDFYALGVILYLAVTGKLPFPLSAHTPQQIVAQRLQSRPVSPRMLRPDLPPAAEQVMLRALAPQPADRYANAEELSSAFLAALAPANTNEQLFFPRQGSTSSTTEAQSVLPAQRDTDAHGELDQTTPMTARGPKKPRSARLSLANNETVPAATPTSPASSPVSAAPLSEVVETPPAASVANTPPPASPPSPPSLRLRLSAFKGLLRPTEETGKQQAITAPNETTSATPAAGLPPSTPDSIQQIQQPLTDALQQTDAEQDTSKRANAAPSPAPNSSSAWAFAATSALPSQEGKKSAQTIKLTDAVKVVQVPVAGQPGRYVTGLLSLSTKSQELEAPAAPATTPPSKALTGKKSWLMLVYAMLALIIVLGASSLLLSHLIPGKQGTRSQAAITAVPNYVATVQAETTATVQANIILEDPLNQNIHNWPVISSNAASYSFSSGAYQIYDNDSNHSAPAILPGITIPGAFVYTLTMEEIKGNDTSINNSFGMIFRFNIQSKGGHNVTTFYSLEVVNEHGGEYQFWKYDDSAKSPASPWTPVWRHPFGSEFHMGHGPRSINTFKIVVNGKNFTFYVNSKKVGAAQNSAIAGGQIGMLVNLKGTEVAFSNLLLTYS